MASRRLLVVHAHPDDECISTGGILARYAAEGAHVCLVTCTNGELGEVAELPGLDGAGERLADVRREELYEACRRLGDIDVRMLGFHDSGMAGTPGNDAEAAFVRRPMQEILDTLLPIVHEVRPQVVVTYNEFGFYGHPDHIRAHEATLAAMDAAEWPISKLYYTAVPKSWLRRAQEYFRVEAGEGPTFDDDTVDTIGTDDEAVTTHVDVTAYVARKFDALEAHRTQYGTTKWLLSVPEEMRDVAMGIESFVLARTRLPRPEGIELDLFEGVA